MTEALFYHLEKQTLLDVLPQLVQRCLERGWKAVVQAGSQERLEAVDGHLWSFDDAAFLPHGSREDGHDAEQPVFLTTGPETPNGANVRFLVDRAPPPPHLEGFERVVVIFDGNDAEALADARVAWKEFKAVGFEVTYWQQDGNGRWQRKA
jgi:DNA polymerase III subunit chi